MSIEFKARLIIGFYVYEPSIFMEQFMKKTEPVFETRAQFCPKTGVKLSVMNVCTSPGYEYWSVCGYNYRKLQDAIDATLAIANARGDISNGRLFIYPEGISEGDSCVSHEAALVFMEEAKRIGQSLKDMGLNPGEPCVRAVLDTW